MLHSSIEHHLMTRVYVIKAAAMGIPSLEDIRD